MGVLSEPVRAWIYRILTAGILVAIVYNVIDPNQAVAWTGFAAALVGNGLATANTRTTNGKSN